MPNKKNDPEIDKGVTEKPKKMVEVELTETLVKYDFSKDELVTIGEDVADFAQELALLEAEAKQISKKYKADIEGVELKQDHFIRLIRDKFEMRKMECFKVVDGARKKVFFYRTDQIDAEKLRQHTINDLRYEVLPVVPAKVRDARPSELQRELPLETTEKTLDGETVTTE